MPSKPNLPETSLEAHAAVTPEMLTNHHGKIISALREAKTGLIYEEIANQVRMDKHAVGRRISELERGGIIYKPGEKRNTSTNRLAFVYKLVENGEKSAEPEKALPGHSIADYSRNIQQASLWSLND